MWNPIIIVLAFIKRRRLDIYLCCDNVNEILKGPIKPNINILDPLISFIGAPIKAKTLIRCLYLVVLFNFISSTLAGEVCAAAIFDSKVRKISTTSSFIPVWFLGSALVSVLLSSNTTWKFCKSFSWFSCFRYLSWKLISVGSIQIFLLVFCLPLIVITSLL